MNSPLLYVGTAGGLHILRGDSARRSWSPAGRALAGHDISALSWDARSSEFLFAGTVAGALLRSADGAHPGSALVPACPIARSGRSCPTRTHHPARSTRVWMAAICSAATIVAPQQADLQLG